MIRSCITNLLGLILRAHGGNNGTVYDEKEESQGGIKTDKAPELYAVGHSKLVFTRNIPQSSAGTSVVTRHF